MEKGVFKYLQLNMEQHYESISAQHKYKLAKDDKTLPTDNSTVLNNEIHCQTLLS